MKNPNNRRREDTVDVNGKSRKYGNYYDHGERQMSNTNRNDNKDRRQYITNRSERGMDKTQNREGEVKDRFGETRTVSVRTFENSNRRSYKYTYPKYSRETLQNPRITREAVPPNYR